MIECLFGQSAGNFSGNSIALMAFIYHDCSAGFFHRIDQGFFIKRYDRARINHLGANALFCQNISGFLGDLNHR